MEIINDNDGGRRGAETNRAERETPRNGYMYLGLTLIIIGFVWLMHNFDIIDTQLFNVLISWQMLMVVIGGYLLTIRKWAAGCIVGGIGLLLVMTDLFDIYISFSKVVMPMSMVAIGIAVLLSTIDRKGKK